MLGLVCLVTDQSFLLISLPFLSLSFPAYPSTLFLKFLFINTLSPSCLPWPLDCLSYYPLTLSPTSLIHVLAPDLPSPLYSPSFSPSFSFLFLLSPPFSLSSWQTSDCVFEPSTRSMSRLYVPGSPQISSSLWSASLNCSAAPVSCCAPVTSAPSSVTSSSLSCRTWTLSGPTTWAERCWRHSRASSSQTRWKERLGKRAFGCWSASTRTTMKRAGSDCLATRHTAQQVTQCTGEKVCLRLWAIPWPWSWMR